MSTTPAPDVSPDTDGRFAFQPRLVANPNPPKEHQFKPGNPGGPGRPSKMALWRAKVEEEFDQWTAVYDQARLSGDPELALKAADRVLDRHFGKPTQSIQHSGGVGLEVVLFDDAKDTLKN